VGLNTWQVPSQKGCLLYKYEKEVDTGSPSNVQLLDNPTNPKKRKLLCAPDDSELLMKMMMVPLLKQT
jgi:hypothetical protein